MSTVIQYKYYQEPRQKLVEKKTENISTATATDMIGLSWIFRDEDILEEFK